MGKILYIVLLAIVLLYAMCCFIAMAWNAVIPEMFSLPPISAGEAFCLWFLAVAFLGVTALN